MRKNKISFVLLCLSGSTIFYLTYLFFLQLVSPNYELLLYEPDPRILFLEIIIALIAGMFCFVKAIREVW